MDDSYRLKPKRRWYFPSLWVFSLIFYSILIHTFSVSSIKHEFGKHSPDLRVVLASVYVLVFAVACMIVEWRFQTKNWQPKRRWCHLGLRSLLVFMLVATLGFVLPGNSLEQEAGKPSTRWRRQGKQTRAGTGLSLCLRGPEVNDATLQQLVSQQTNLWALTLSDTNVTDTGFEHLKDLTGLTSLTIHDTAVGDAVLEHVEKLTSLQSLDLSMIELRHVEGELRGTVKPTKITDSGLRYLKRMKELTSLNLIGSRVSDAGLVHLKGLTSLRELRLDATEVTDAGLEHLKEIKSLKHLSLAGTRVTNEGMKRLQKALPDCNIAD